jgi:uncharacterized protein YqeY
MNIRETVLAEIKEAMKAKDQVRLSTLRMLNSSIKNKEIELRPAAMSDQDVLGVVKKLAKQRRESIEQFSAAGRQDLADQESTELAILERYLPAALSEAQLEKVVSTVIADLGATTIKDMGAVMKEVTARTEGAADNKVVSTLVRAKLQ